MRKTIYGSESRAIEQSLNTFYGQFNPTLKTQGSLLQTDLEAVQTLITSKASLAMDYVETYFTTDPFTLVVIAGLSFIFLMTLNENWEV